MRVLWFTPSPGLYSPTTYGTWVEALQKAIMKYGKDLEVGLIREIFLYHLPYYLFYKKDIKAAVCCLEAFFLDTRKIQIRVI